jgi:hypothetical protein
MTILKTTEREDERFTVVMKAVCRSFMGNCLRCTYNKRIASDDAK